MTVAAINNYATFAGNGTTGPFTFAFTFDVNSEIVITLTDSLGNVTVISSANYTLTGVGSESGGSVTMGTAVAAGYTLTVTRVLPLAQTLDLEYGGPFSAPSLMQALDRIVKMIQQQNNAAQADATLLSYVNQALSVLAGLAAKADIASPTFTGTVTAPTLDSTSAAITTLAATNLAVSGGITVPNRSALDNGLNAANTAFVQAAVAGTVTTKTAWTPALNIGGATTGIAYSTQSGYYTITNGVVTAAFNIILSSKGALTGNLSISGLPIASSMPSANALGYYTGLSGLTGALLGWIINGSSIILGQWSATAATAITNSNLTNTTQLTGTITYLE